MTISFLVENACKFATCMLQLPHGTRTGGAHVYAGNGGQAGDYLSWLDTNQERTRRKDVPLCSKMGKERAIHHSNNQTAKTNEREDYSETSRIASQEAQNVRSLSSNSFADNLDNRPRNHTATYCSRLYPFVHIVLTVSSVCQVRLGGKCVVV